MEMGPELVKKFKSARCDAAAIHTTYGLLATMVVATEREAELGLHMTGKSECGDMGEQWICRAADTLQSVRDKIDAILQELGDHQNAHDSVPGYMMPVGDPVYAIMRQRKAGELLDI